MLLSIRHTTTYSYDAPVTAALQQVRLVPRSNTLQTVQDWQLTIEGGVEELHFDDQFGNDTRLVSLDDESQTLRIIAQGQVEVHETNGVLGKVYGKAPLWLFKRHTPLTTPGKGVASLVRKQKAALAKPDQQLSALHALSASIREKVAYEINTTNTRTTAEDALAGGQGVCQDHAHIFCAAARLAGIPARYVSGYLKLDNTVDQSASHAWAEGHVDGLGWVGFDISNGISPDERYVRIGHGMDFRDCAPVLGMRKGGASESMVVSLQVQQ
ncbi:MAG: transglutaminase family protein [Pseudomonadota bacterium]